MALIQTEVKIPQVERTIPVHLYFPTDLPDSVGNKIKGVITLLHGVSNTGADWMTMTAAPRYAADNGYILIAPDAQNSFYLDGKNESPFFTTLSEYLPQALSHIYKIPTQREMNFVAGNSMGGYGAMVFGLNHPERYAACGGFSGVVDFNLMQDLFYSYPAGQDILRSTLGDEKVLPPQGDITQLVKKNSALPPSQQTQLFTTCGKQDRMLGDIFTQNRNFYALTQSHNLPHTHLEWNGEHEWNFWDRSLAEFIGFIQKSDYGKRKQGDWSTPAESFTGVRV